MMEWKDIPGYETIYQVSSTGVVKSLQRYRPYKDGFRIVKEKIMNPTMVQGYLRVKLSKNRFTKVYRVHQLVSMAFLEHKPSDSNKVVDHIDNNKLNNNVSNLQIISTRLNSSKDRKNKYSNFTGVTFSKARGKWIAQAYISGRLLNLGGFENEIDAKIKYDEAIKNIDYYDL